MSHGLSDVPSFPVAIVDVSIKNVPNIKIFEGRLNIKHEVRKDEEEDHTFMLFIETPVKIKENL